MKPEYPFSVSVWIKFDSESIYDNICFYDSLTLGKHSVSVLVDEVCTYDTMVYITGNEYFLVSLPNDTIVTLGNSLNVEPHQSGFSNYLWLPDIYLDCNDCQKVLSTPFDDISYVLRVEDEFGCYAYDN